MHFLVGDGVGVGVGVGDSEVVSVGGGVECDVVGGGVECDVVGGGVEWDVVCGCELLVGPAGVEESVGVVPPTALVGG